MTHARPRVALATARHLPALDADGPALLDALASRGIDARPAVWDDAVDWGAFDLVVIRSTWDYVPVRDAFVAWAEAVARTTRLCNPAPVVRWNTDKRYLADLAAAGIPTVPTRFLAPGEPFDAGAHGWDAEEVVLKPANSAGARAPARYLSDDAAAIRAHVEMLHGGGHTAMVQPYLGRIDAEGERALIHLGGTYSHAVRKAALLVERGAAGIRWQEAPEVITAAEPDPAMRAMAARALAALPREVVPDAAELLYARVDLAPGEDGPLLLELELTEPSLFLGHAPGAAARLADAIVAALAE